MYMGTGLGYGYSAAVLLTYLIKFLFVVFIISLAGGLIVYVKNNIFTPEDIENFKAPFRGKRNEVKKATCNVCGKEINDDWKACPYCSATIEK